LKEIFEGFLTECDGRFTPDQWEDFKLKVKRLNVIHSLRLASNRLADFETLERKLESLTVKEEILKCKDDMKHLLLYKVESLRIRAKADELTNGDFPTKFLLKRERDRADNKHTEKIVDNGVEHTRSRDIISVVHSYYKSLYKSQASNGKKIDDLVKDAPRLEEVDSSLCEGRISYNECLKTITTMKNEKSPGPDGLPAEFYKHYFHLFGDAFVAMINEVFESASALPASMRLSYITLLCKRPEQAWFSNNWRPISLLNVDYKII
jgi:hypothetical protein